MSAAAAETRIHPTAVLEPQVELGAGVQVGPFCVVESGARLGAGCRLEPHVYVHGCATIGAGTHLGTGTVIGGAPQDVTYAGEPTRVRIGAGCRLHEHVTVHRATGDGETVIGDGVMMMAESHVGHNCRIADHVILVNGAMVGGHAQIGERAFLSGNCAVHQFCRVGRITLVGGASMVIKDAPPFSIVAGSYPICWRAPNSVGLRRAGFGPEQRDAVRRALFELFKSWRSPIDVAEGLRESTSAEVRELAEFVLSSRRGLCVGSREGDAGDAASE